MSNGSGSHANLNINQKIILWVKGKLGKQVGRGLCWDLAEEALDKAGAQTSNDLGPVGEDTDYIWGDKVENVKDIERGDILQIRDHLVKKTTVIEYKFTDGSTWTETKERTARRGHHTAIVRSKPDANGTLKTFEQHVNGRDVVQRLKLPTRSIGARTKYSIGKGKNPRTKKIEQAKITKTVTVEVTGTIWAYRPKPK